MLTGGAGGRAMTRAFEELYGVADAFRGVPFNGRTDAWILSQAAAAHAVPPDALASFKPLYLEYLAAELSSRARARASCPACAPLLDTLADVTTCYLALLTGNFAKARGSSSNTSICGGTFACGAFGDAVHDRNGLLPMRWRRVEACGGPAAAAADAVVIGDTPLDVGVRCPAARDRSPSRPAATRRTSCARPAPTSCSKI